MHEKLLQHAKGTGSSAKVGTVTARQPLDYDSDSEAFASSGVLHIFDYAGARVLIVQLASRGVQTSPCAAYQVRNPTSKKQAHGISGVEEFLHACCRLVHVGAIRSRLWLACPQLQ